MSEIPLADLINVCVRPALTCPCGSKLPAWRLYDARGIYCCRACDGCEKEKRSHYRAEIFENPSYEVDEQIEPD